jgi:hypothetical protein
MAPLQDAIHGGLDSAPYAQQALALATLCRAFGAGCESSVLTDPETLSRLLKRSKEVVKEVETHSNSIVGS